MPLALERQRRRRRCVRRMWSLERLPLPRAFFHGPRWRSTCGVRDVPIADVDPIAARYHRPGRRLLMFTLEEEVRAVVTRGGAGARNEREAVPGARVFPSSAGGPVE